MSLTIIIMIIIIINRKCGNYDALQLEAARRRAKCSPHCETHNAPDYKSNNSARNVSSSECTFVSVLVKFVLRMRSTCYFQAFG